MKGRSPSKLNTSSNEDKLKIIIRIRPVLNEQDPSMFVNLENNDTLEIRRPGNHSFMKFNNILPPESTQKDVFHLVEDSIRQFLKGINTTIFAYGQTGAGKTYSIIGNYSPNESQQNLFNFLSSKQRGILSRSLQMIMNNVGKQTKVFVSFYQIYNQKIYDLYNNTLIPLQIRQSKNGEISIPDLVNLEITRMQDAIQFLMVGLKNRVTGSTHANAKSSRSHSIFQISIQREEGDQTICSSLRIVDLAGSEKFKIPSDISNYQKQIRILELTSINGSLSCLGHCISALIEKSRTHIPFRNSKLTRILSDSLLGQGKMRFIICISPSSSASAETFSTLQFANRAKRAIFERTDLKSPSIQKKKSQSQEFISLKRQLQRQRQIRMQIEKQLSDLKRSHEQLKIQNSHLLSKLQQAHHHNHKNDKENGLYSKVNYYDQNKENDFKEQMLKLTIFQKNKLSNITLPNDQQPHQHNPNLNKSAINKKKVEFEKKIKKFIESDSPVRPHKKQQQYSFENEHFEFLNHPLNEQAESHARTLFNQNYEQQNEQNEVLWDTHKDDSNQLIQKACTKMNLSQFQQLKSQMQRARQQLLNLRKKDKQLQQRKMIVR